MPFQLKPFKELVAMSKQAVDEAMAPIRARAAKAKANLEMSKLDEQVVGIEREIQELAVSKEIDFARMADKIDELGLLELRRTRYEEILAQLFPTEA